MKPIQRSLLIWNCIICFSIGCFFINSLVGHCEEIKSSTEFRYQQKPIRKVKEKSFKIRVAISRFEEETEIKGSPFNIKKDEKKELYETAIDIDDSEVTIKIDDEIKEEEEMSKSELLNGLLTDALRKTEMFELVERKEINELIREINFQNSNWVKESNVNTLGNIFGVQYILTGEILRNRDIERISKERYTLALRMYNVNTGEIISSSTASHPYLTGAVSQAVEELSASIQSKPWTCRIVGIDDTGIYINAGLRDDLEKRDTFYIYRIGEKIIDPKTNEILGFSKKKIALIKIEDILEDNLSRAKTVEEYERIIIGDIVSAERIDKKKKSELELWRKIYGVEKVDREISTGELNKYSLTSYDFSPEEIMESYGKSVVKIQSDVSLGSGFIVSIAGYIITNFHVIQDAKFVNVKMIERNKYFTDVQIVKAIPERDIALLKINNVDNLPAANLGDSDNIKIGERVIAIGNPEGFENTISDGLISGIRNFNGAMLLQTSVPVTRGSSGGPLLNMRGEVIGVVAAGLEKKGEINFAVPINYVKEELLNF